MRVARTPDGSVRVRHGAALLRAILLALAGAIALAAWSQSPRDPLKTGLCLLGVVLLLAGALVYESCDFEFDALRRRLRWQRRNLLWTLVGEIPFDDIREVQVLTALERSPDRPFERPQRTHRLVLATRDGPLHFANRTLYGDRHVEEIAAAIRHVLGQREAPRSPDAEVARLAAAGQILDAVTLLRRQHGIGLAEARARVEALRAGATARPGQQRENSAP